MNIAHLFDQDGIVIAHALMAIAALIIGGIQFAMPKGIQIHRRIGYTWVILMAGTALSALFIHKIKTWGLFSPIHLLIPVTLTSIWLAINAAKKKRIRRHKMILLNLYIFALVVTGAFTLLPGRVMHTLVFG